MSRGERVRPGDVVEHHGTLARVIRRAWNGRLVLMPIVSDAAAGLSATRFRWAERADVRKVTT